MTTTPTRVELVHDFVCARSYTTFTRLRRALGRHRAEGGEAELTLRPYRIRPEAPTDGEPLFALHTRERGEEAAREIAADTERGRADGLRFHFAEALFTNTFDAHLLVARAAQQELALPMAERIFRAYFTNALDLADPATLTALAHDVGVRPGPGGTEELHAALARTRDLGSETGPVLLVNGTLALPGVEEPTEDTLLALLRQH